MEPAYEISARGSLLLPSGRLLTPGTPITREMLADRPGRFQEALRDQTIVPAGVQPLLDGGVGVGVGNSDKTPLTEATAPKGVKQERDLEAELKAFKERQATLAAEEIEAARAAEAEAARAAEAAEAGDESDEDLAPAPEDLDEEV